MNGTLEIVFACKKDTAIARNLVQSFETLPIFFNCFPGRSQIIVQSEQDPNRKEHLAKKWDYLDKN
jgi:hypothetical protein